MQRVLLFENAAVPLSLFADDGTPLSCVKSQFMYKLEDLLPGEKITSVAEADAIIFDGHAVIQMIGSGASGTRLVTFRDMAENFLRHFLHRCEIHGRVQQIHSAFDRYDSDSIKNQTREKRSSGMKGQEYHIQLDVQVPKALNAFFGRGENKPNLPGATLTT